MALITPSISRICVRDLYFTLLASVSNHLEECDKSSSCSIAELLIGLGDYCLSGECCLHYVSEHAKPSLLLGMIGTPRIPPAAWPLATRYVFGALMLSVFAGISFFSTQQSAHLRQTLLLKLLKCGVDSGFVRSEMLNDQSDESWSFDIDKWGIVAKYRCVEDAWITTNKNMDCCDIRSCTKASYDLRAVGNSYSIDEDESEESEGEDEDSGRESADGSDNTSNNINILRFGNHDTDCDDEYEDDEDEDDEDEDHEDEDDEGTDIDDYDPHDVKDILYRNDFVDETDCDGNHECDACLFLGDIPYDVGRFDRRYKFVAPGIMRTQCVITNSSLNPDIGGNTASNQTSQIPNCELREQRRNAQNPTTAVSSSVLTATPAMSAASVREQNADELRKVLVSALRWPCVVNLGRSAAGLRSGLAKIRKALCTP